MMLLILRLLPLMITPLRAVDDILLDACFAALSHERAALRLRRLLAGCCFADDARYFVRAPAAVISRLSAIDARADMLRRYACRDA